LRFLDRFTRDEVSAKVWWPFALVCIVVLVASAPLANRSAQQARDDEAYRAASLSIDSIEPLTTAGATAAELTPTLAALAATDPAVTAVRVWDAQYALVASSVSTDQLDSAEALNDGDIDNAVSDGTTWVVSDRLPTGDAGPVTYYAYSSIKGTAGPLVTQFEAPDATLLADVHRFWLGFRIVFAVAVLLLLALAGLSMREPVAKIGTEVPFYPESVPPWLAVIDVDRAVALEQAGDRAKDRLTNLQQRLDESERMRHAAEGELQQALTALSAASADPRGRGCGRGGGRGVGEGGEDAASEARGTSAGRGQARAGQDQVEAQAGPRRARAGGRSASRARRDPGAASDRPRAGPHEGAPARIGQRAGR
jgi:hypothetical protein